MERDWVDGLNDFIEWMMPVDPFRLVNGISPFKNHYCGVANKIR